MNCRPSFKTGPRDERGGGQRRRARLLSASTARARALLTQIVEAPLGTEPDLPLQVVGMLRPQLQDGEATADAGLGHRQLVLTCAGEKKVT